VHEIRALTLPPIVIHFISPMTKPRKKAADRRSVLVVVRVTKAEEKAMKKAAKVAGVKFSAWLRGKMLHERNSDQ
jgi:hypothetical protein